MTETGRHWPVPLHSREDVCIHAIRSLFATLLASSFRKVNQLGARTAGGEDATMTTKPAGSLLTFLSLQIEALTEAQLLCSPVGM